MTENNQILDKVNIFIENKDMNSLLKFIDTLNEDIWQETLDEILKKIISYTNGYKNYNSNSKVFKIASKLIELGANNENIFNKLKQKTVKQMNLWWQMMQNLECYKEEKICWTFVDIWDVLDFELEEKQVFWLLDEFILTLAKAKLVYVWIIHDSKIEIKINSRSDKKLIEQIYKEFEVHLWDKIVFDWFSKEDVINIFINKI